MSFFFLAHPVQCNKNKLKNEYIMSLKRNSINPTKILKQQQNLFEYDVTYSLIVQSFLLSVNFYAQIILQKEVSFVSRVCIV